MVLGRNHRQDGLAIGEAKDGNLLASHEFLNNHPAACAAKCLVTHDFINGTKSLIQRHGNDNALACCQAVSLDNDRRTLCPDICLGCLCLGKYLILGSRDIVLLHEIF